MSHVIDNLLLVYTLLRYWYLTIGYDVMYFIMLGFSIGEVRSVQSGKVLAEEPSGTRKEWFRYQEPERLW